MQTSRKEAEVMVRIQEEVADGDGQKVFQVLSSTPRKWYLVSTLSQKTELPEEKITKILREHRGLVRHWPVRDYGDIYAIASMPVDIHEIFAQDWAERPLFRGEETFAEIQARVQSLKPW